MRFNPEKHRRQSIRLKGYDYRSPGYYFITICCYKKECFLGNIINNKMILNDWGRIVEKTWHDLPNHNPNVSLDAFIIMPNHIHGIIRLVGAGSKPALNMYDGSRADLESAPTKNHSLSEIVRQLKTFSTRRINEKINCVGTKIWQRNYFDHIIRDIKELKLTRQYIKINPHHWDRDVENPLNINTASEFSYNY
jgi:REP element-mobilizing transposase RayT